MCTISVLESIPEPCRYGIGMSGIEFSSAYRDLVCFPMPSLGIGTAWHGWYGAVRSGGTFHGTPTQYIILYIGTGHPISNVSIEIFWIFSVPECRDAMEH